MFSLDKFEKLAEFPGTPIITRMVLTDKHNPTRAMSATPEITGWWEIPAALEVDLYQFCGFADALSSLYIKNTGTEPLRIRFVVHGHLIWGKTLAVKSVGNVFEFFAEPYARCSLPFSSIYVDFSHVHYTSKIRYLLWSGEIRNARAQENPVMVMGDNFYYACNGMLWEMFAAPLDLVPADLQGYLLRELNTKHVPHPRNRLYEWVRYLPEPEPGKYTLPAEPQIYSSIYVENPTDEPITLRLLPNFRHRYILQPGTNLLELFWQEFWPGGSTEHYYFQSRQSGLKISLRVGNQRDASVRYSQVPGPTYNETASTLISPDYYVYRCQPHEPPKLTACYNRKDLQSTCLLGLHSRIGKDSSLRVYFQDHPLSERYLLPEIWRFL